MPASLVAKEEVSINEAWNAVLAHLPTLLLTWVASVMIGIVAYVSSVIALGFFSALDSSESGTIVALILSQLVNIPLNIFAQFVGILFVAVPALYYAMGEIVTPGAAFATLFSRPMRYLGAGFLFAIAVTVGTLFCIVPGIAVALTMPVFVNKVFTTNMAVVDAFSSSFSAVYKGEAGWSFVGVQILAYLCVIVISICTCGIGALVALPVSTFYVQHSAYSKGMVS